MLSIKAKRIAVLGLILFGTAAGLLLSELLLRVHPPQWLKLKMTGLNLRSSAELFGSDAGWSVERVDGKFLKFTPHSQFHMSNLEFEVDAHIDSWGARIVTGNPSTRGKIVPFLGDSFMFGIGVEDQQTLVSLLQPGSPLRFLNLGVPGSALPQHMDILEMRYRELGSPKACVFSFFTGNDYMDIIKYYTESHGGTVVQEKTSPWLLRALQAAIVNFHFLGRSYLVEFCKQILINRAYDEKQNTPPHKVWAIHFPNGGHVIRESIVLMDKRERLRGNAEEYLEKALDRFQEFSRQNGMAAYFIIIPDRYQIDPDLLNDKLDGTGLTTDALDPRLPDRIIDEELQQYGYPYLDLFDCLNGKKGQYYDFDDHFTPQGAQTAAECISKPLQAFLASVKGL